MLHFISFFTFGLQGRRRKKIKLTIFLTKVLHNVNHPVLKVSASFMSIYR